MQSGEWRVESGGWSLRTEVNLSKPPAADDLPLTGKVAATEVADGKREKAVRSHYINSVQNY